jgi:P27 family predicted phage terminase small subunit
VRGRPSVPSALKALRGNPGRRPLNSSEPDAALLTKLPPPPLWLGRIAKKEWRARVRQLQEMHMLAEADLSMLGRLCVWHQRFVEASTRYNKLAPEQMASMTATNLQNTMSMASKQLKAIEEQFGFSPAARSRIKVANPKQRSFADILNDDLDAIAEAEDEPDPEVPVSSGVRVSAPRRRDELN